MSNKYGYDITIREVMNGFVVRIGCEHIAIEADNRLLAVDRLCSALQEYLTDRTGQQKMWYQTFRPGQAREGAPTEPTATPEAGSAAAEGVQLP